MHKNPCDIIGRFAQNIKPYFVFCLLAVCLAVCLSLFTARGSLRFIDCAGRQSRERFAVHYVFSVEDFTKSITTISGLQKILTGGPM